MGRGDIHTGPVTLDDVAMGIIDHGFLDVSFDSVAWLIRVPVNTLMEASGNSLFTAIQRAMDIAISRYEWPVFYPDWYSLLEHNTPVFYQALCDYPGMARLISNGVVGPVIVERIYLCAGMLSMGGLSKGEALVAMETALTVAINIRASVEGIMSKTGNLAELTVPYADDEAIIEGTEAPFMAGLSHVFKQGPLALPENSSISVDVLKEYAVEFEKIVHLSPDDWFFQKLWIELNGLRALFSSK